MFTVTNTSGSEAVVDSLPWALREAWTSPGNDTIRFNLFNVPGWPDGRFHITVTTAVPLAVGDADGTSGIVIDGTDGTTQPGYYNFPIIWINANGKDTAFNVTGRGSTIKGLGMYNFSTVGIALLDQGSSPGGHLVDDCWIGFQLLPPPPHIGYVTNTQYHGHPLSIGISAEVPDNVITNNIISGLYNSIVIGKDPVKDPSSSTDYWISYNNYIANNRIGTVPQVGGGGPWAYFGNTSDSVVLGNGATYNHIAYNVIGDNAGTGVKLLGSSGVVNYVYGNLIGVDHDGSDIGNGEFGVLVANRSNNNYIGNWVGNYVYNNSLGGIAVGVATPATGTRVMHTTTPLATTSFLQTMTAVAGELAFRSRETPGSMQSKETISSDTRCME